MKLEERLEAHRKSFEQKAPKEALEIMHRATEDLRNSGILARTVKTGDMAPDFSLKNIHGQVVDLSDLLDGGPVVASFYRGRW